MTFPVNIKSFVMFRLAYESIRVDSTSLSERYKNHLILNTQKTLRLYIRVYPKNNLCISTSFFLHCGSPNFSSNGSAIVILRFFYSGLNLEEIDMKKVCKSVVVNHMCDVTRYWNSKFYHHFEDAMLHSNDRKQLRDFLLSCCYITSPSSVPQRAPHQCWRRNVYIR